MKTKKLFLCAALIAVAVLPFAGWSLEENAPERSAHGAMRERRGHGKRALAGLGLTPEQEAKIVDIRMRSAAAMRVHAKQVEAAYAKIDQELLKERPSKSALNRHAAEIGRLHRQMGQASIDLRLEIKNALSPEQFAQMSARGFIDAGMYARGNGPRGAGCRDSFRRRGPDHPRYGPGGKPGGPRGNPRGDENNDDIPDLHNPPAEPVTPVPPIYKFDGGEGAVDEAERGGAVIIEDGNEI